jgi:DNA-binding response OmpR family regulator
LWISIPSVAAVLETANDRACSVPDLEIELTRRERQILDVLYRSPHPLRHRQLAALVWSEPDRTHGVRTVLHRLRRKLRDSSWSIPFPARGKGVRLVADVTAQHQAASSGARPDDASGGLLRLAA